MQCKRQISLQDRHLKMEYIVRISELFEDNNFLSTIARALRKIIWRHYLIISLSQKLIKKTSSLSHRVICLPRSNNYIEKVSGTKSVVCGHHNQYRFRREGKIDLEITLCLVLPFFRPPSSVTSNLFSIYYMTWDRQYLHSLAMSQSQALHSYFFSIDLLIQFLVWSLFQNLPVYLILFATIHIFAWPLGCRAEREFWNNIKHFHYGITCPKHWDWQYEKPWKWLAVNFLKIFQALQ